MPLSEHATITDITGEVAQTFLSSMNHTFSIGDGMTLKNGKTGIAIGAGIGIVLGAGSGNPGLGLVIGAALGLLYNALEGRSR